MVPPRNGCKREFQGTYIVRIISIEFLIKGGSHKQPRERRKRDQEGKLQEVDLLLEQMYSMFTCGYSSPARDKDDCNTPSLPLHPYPIGQLGAEAADLHVGLRSEAVEGGFTEEATLTIFYFYGFLIGRPEAEI
jgi:hypothetical protein